MDIKVFVWEGYLEDKFSMKIIDLIKSASLHYTLLPIKKDAEMDVISTMVGSKVRKLNNFLQTEQFEADVISERGFDVTIDGKFLIQKIIQA